jgi:hypothetical protein
MEKLVVSSPGIAQRIHRVLAGFAEKRLFSNESRYMPPVIWRGGMRLQPNLRFARAASRPARDEGRPKEMSGRQWKRLKKSEHHVARVGHDMAVAKADWKETKAPEAARLAIVLSREVSKHQRRIHAAHASCDKPSTGAKFRAGGGQRRLRIVEYER